MMISNEKVITSTATLELIRDIAERVLDRIRLKAKTTAFLWRDSEDELMRMAWSSQMIGDLFIDEMERLK